MKTLKAMRSKKEEIERVVFRLIDAFDDEFTLRVYGIEVLYNDDGELCRVRMITQNPLESGMYPGTDRIRASL